MRSLIPAILALACVSTHAADPKEKPLGRSAQQRFNATMEEQQAMVFDTRQGAVGDARSYEAGKARTKSFQFSKSFSAANYETGKFQTKKSWLDRFKFGTKSARLGSKSAVPKAEAAFATKVASTKDARDGAKTAAVSEMPGSDRPYLGPERKKLDRAVDPSKPLPGWTGDKLEVLTIEDIRELLNKNK